MNQNSQYCIQLKKRVATQQEFLGIILNKSKSCKLHITTGPQWKSLLQEW